MIYSLGAAMTLSIAVLVTNPVLAQSNIEEALNRGDGAALVTLINGTDNTDFSGKESAVRIVLLERLLLLSQTDKDSRTTTAIALLKLFPEDTVIAEIAAAEGTEPPNPIPTTTQHPAQKRP